ncbi:hypothetical protein, partial [Anaerostipes sp.]|uniref:hypothetical protein n=1 Tax=Anaerostipes sp. TaxID=1872530 RepID=UPI003992D6A1
FGPIFLTLFFHTSLDTIDTQGKLCSYLFFDHNVVFRRRSGNSIAFRMQNAAVFRYSSDCGTCLFNPNISLSDI